jgi:hypothetical protein
MRPKSLPILRAPVIFAALACCAAGVGQTDKGQQNPAPSVSSTVVACKVLEIHSSAQSRVAVVLFHQRDRTDQSRFASLLKQADGSTVEIKNARSDWQVVSVARLRDCFGRGLLVLSSDAVKLGDGDDFMVRFAALPAER